MLDPDNLSITVFLILLPLLNSLLDFTSWGISRSFGRSLLKHRGGWNALTLAALDLLCAVLLLGGLAAAIAFTFEGINTLALSKTDATVFDS